MEAPKKTLYSLYSIVQFTQELLLVSEQQNKTNGTSGCKAVQNAASLHPPNSLYPPLRVYASMPALSP